MTIVPPDLKSSARALRSNATDVEQILWRELRRYRPRFTRQFVVGNAIVDFACRKARLAVELDGGQHCESRRDEWRTARLEAAGWKVLRFWNNDVLENPEGVLETILSAVAERLPERTHPQPLPEIREGRRAHPRNLIPESRGEGMAT